jgi:DNA-binding transcriptional MocR family regulator
MSGIRRLAEVKRQANFKCQGLPNLAFFPFDTLEAQTAKPNRWTPTPNHPSPIDSDPAPANPSTTSHITVPKSQASEPDPEKKIDLATALQYGTAEGYPPLLSFVRQFAREILHPNVPYKGGPEVILTCGSTDGMSKTLDLLTDPWSERRGDPVSRRPGLLCEVFMYSNVLNQSLPRGLNIAPVEVDSDGMMAHGEGGLEDVLANWDYGRGRRPHLMYTVTMGHNPTGTLLSVERRKELYAICSKYDVIIVEDDPYWYLQYPSAALGEARSRGLPPPPQPAASQEAPKKSSGYDFIDSLTPSYLSIDTDGRVIRLDTFSKTIAPGCRMGWITAQPDLVERLLRVAETSTQQPSGFVQSMVAQLTLGHQPDAQRSFFSLKSDSQRMAFTGWSADGWVRWLSGLRGSYERRMHRMCTILDQHCYLLKQSRAVHPHSPLSDYAVVEKTRLMSFDWPRGGMFVWLRIHFESHPCWHARGPSLGIIDGPKLSTAMMIFLSHKPHLVLASPGMIFSANDEIKAEKGWGYYRLCFAAESEENVDASSTRFGEGVESFFRVKDPRVIEELIKEMSIQESQEKLLGDGVGNLATWMGC